MVVSLPLGRLGHPGVSGVYHIQSRMVMSSLWHGLRLGMQRVPDPDMGPRASSICQQLREHTTDPSIEWFDFAIRSWLIRASSFVGRLDTCELLLNCTLPKILSSISKDLFWSTVVNVYR